MRKRILASIIMFLCNYAYKKYATNDLLYIRGTGNKYPRFMMYTNDKEVYKSMKEECNIVGSE